MPPDCERYLNRVEHMLYCDQADKTRLIAGLRQEILENFPDVSALTEESIIQHYGPPETAAQALQEALSASKIRKVFRQYRYGMRLGIAAAVAAVVLLACYILFSYTTKVSYIDKKIVGTISVHYYSMKE